MTTNKKSDMRCSRLDLWSGLPMEVTARRVWAWDCLHHRHTQNRCRYNLMAWVHYQSNSWKLLHKESQDEPKQRSERKLDDSLKKKCELELDNTTKHEDLNLVFANHGEEDEIYPLTIIEIAEAQIRDWRSTARKMLKNQKRDICLHLFEDTKVLCKDNKLIIPASLQHRAVSWYHHYLQHLGHFWLKETIDPWCTGKICAIPSGHMSNLADLAK